MNEKNSARNSIPAISSGFLILVVFVAQPASAFQSYPIGSAHDRITDATLATPGMGPFNLATIDAIKAGVRSVDFRESQWAPQLGPFWKGHAWIPNDNYRSWHHCDRNPQVGDTHASAFIAAADYIQSETAAAIAALVAGTPLSALDNISSALHAIQDCKSHSNYVDLTPADQAAFHFALWDPTLPAPPAATKITGYDGLPNPEHPPGDPYPHDKNAKDDPTHGDPGGQASMVQANGKTKYENAFAAAVSESVDLLQRIKNNVTAAQWTSLTTALPDWLLFLEDYKWISHATCGFGGCSFGANGTTVTVSPGTFSSPTRVVLLNPPLGFLYGPEGMQGSDGSWMAVLREIRPDSGVFAPPLEVRMIFQNAEVPCLDPSTLGVYFADPAIGKWVRLPGAAVDFVHREALFPVSKGGSFAIGGMQLSGASCSDEDDALIGGVVRPPDRGAWKSPLQPSAGITFLAALVAVAWLAYRRN